LRRLLIGRLAHLTKALLPHLALSTIKSIIKRHRLIRF
jgi:hypothetical protein